MTTTAEPALNGYLVEAARAVNDAAAELRKAESVGHDTAKLKRAHRRAENYLWFIAGQSERLVRRALEAAGDDDE
jgi:hypothetical protein